MNQSLDGVRAENLLADVDRLRGSPCAKCGAPLDGRAVLAAIWLGFRDAPRCPRCVAVGLGRDVDEFFAHVRAALLRRDCFREAWETVVDREGDGAAAAPPTSCAKAASSAAPADSAPSAAAIADAAAPAATWDAGDLGCGDLVLELRTRLRALPPGATFLLLARDPGAREDLPAWCGLVGHRLLEAAHPRYLIRRKDDRS